MSKFPLDISEIKAGLFVNLLKHGYQKKRGRKQPLCWLSWSPHVGQMLYDNVRVTLLSRSL